MARISKTEVEKELHSIAELIKKVPSGLSRQQISKAYAAEYKASLASRTLQRRLEQLVTQGSIVVGGGGPATIYQAQSKEGREETPEDGAIPLTSQGERLRDLVRRPLVDRSPEGYDRDWLHNYKPGKTWYLQKSVRASLHALGKTSDDNRPAGTFSRDILGRLLIDLSWASSRLEGNTYTRLDTQNLIEFGQRAAGKDAFEAQMILNHKAAIELIVSESDLIGFNRQTFLALHAALSENLLGDPKDEGRLRERPVSITGTSYTPTAIPQVITESFDTLLDTAAAIADPFEASFFIMVHLPYLQPFADVNKRTSRLAANIPLISANLCPLSFIDVPTPAYVEGTIAVYEQRKTDLLRDVYNYAYTRSSAQYRVIRDSLPEPDSIRLRYRTQIADIVSSMVTSMQPPREELIKGHAIERGIDTEHLDDVTERALQQLINLNLGSAARYKIRPSEFEAWSQYFRKSKS